MFTKSASAIINSYHQKGVKQYVLTGCNVSLSNDPLINVVLGLF